MSEEKENDVRELVAEIARLEAQLALMKGYIRPPPLSWVTKDGYVRLPDFVTKHLGLEPCSRGVVFNTAPDGRIVMLSNVQALAEYGEAEE